VLLKYDVCLQLQDEVGDFLGSILMHPYQPPTRAPHMYAPTSQPLAATGQTGAGKVERKGKHLSSNSLECESSSPAAKRSRPG
jgi:hypothetical protein